MNVKAILLFLKKSLSPKSNILHRNFLERFDQFSTLKNDFENQNFEMFLEVVHNFGTSDC